MKWKKLALGTGIGLTLAATAPVVPVEMEWFGSYETVAFDTPDGDIGVHEYAIDPDGMTYYIREVPKSKGNFEGTTDTRAVEGKKLVSIRAMKNEDNPNCDGCAYYSVFVRRDGEMVRVPYEGRYKDLIEIPGALRPRKTEFVSTISAALADAAIAFDATSNDGDPGAVSSGSFAHTSTGTDLLIFVGVSMDDTIESDMNVTALTYNTVSLTEIRRDLNSPDNVASEIWYDAGPSTGSNTVSYTLNGTVSNVTAGAITLTGVDQSSPLDADNGATGSDANATVSVTTIADNAWVLNAVILQGGNGSDCGFSTGTQDWDVAVGAGRGCWAGGHQGPKTPAGATTVTWTQSHISDDFAISAASFKPATAAAAATFDSTFFDVMSE